MAEIEFQAEEPVLFDLVRCVLPPSVLVRPREPGSPRPPRQPAAVIVAASKSSPSFLEQRLSALRERDLIARTVVVTPFSRPEATVLAHFAVAGVVWLDHLRKDLPGLVAQVLDSDLCSWLEQELIRRCGRDRLLLSAIRAAFLIDPPGWRVQTLAAAVHCSESTLRRRWQRSDLPETPRALSEWISLLRVLEARESQAGRGAGARVVGLHVSTLYRLARRRAGRKPTQLTRSDMARRLQAWLDVAG